MILLTLLTSCKTFPIEVKEVVKPQIKFKLGMSEEEKLRITLQVAAKYIVELKIEYDKLVDTIKIADGYTIKVIDLSEKKE
jgi:hypothetical protein